MNSYKTNMGVQVHGEAWLELETDKSIDEALDNLEEKRPDLQILEVDRANERVKIMDTELGGFVWVCDHCSIFKDEDKELVEEHEETCLWGR